MRPVIQAEPTGCGIASVAAVARVSYVEAKKVANQLGIRAQDELLWSETAYVRRLLRHFGLRAQNGEQPFVSWNELPHLALIAIKWHREKDRPFWHWAVFVRDRQGSYVLDSKRALRHHKRTDFGRIKPKWYIEVKRLANPVPQTALCQNRKP
jgi:ABC-type bacteriocin/lantibiotic exporter with double-glycine peptidase domain